MSISGIWRLFHDSTSGFKYFKPKGFELENASSFEEKRQTVVFFIEVLIALIEISRETVPLRRSAKMN
jgi:hypothetical protein